MTKKFGPGGEVDQRGGLTMHQFSSVSKVSLKTDFTVSENDNDAAFWSALSGSHTSKGYDVAVLPASSNTTEQTIVDTTGSGILTTVLSPALSASGVMTIRVTVDGTTKTFTSETMTAANDNRFAVGGFVPYQAASAADSGVGFGSGRDTGYGDVSIAMPNPIQSAMNFHGIKFNSTLKVTIQGSVAISSTTEMNKAAACYTRHIPEGL